jgi:iron complex outermembrane receptor protein
MAALSGAPAALVQAQDGVSSLEFLSPLAFEIDAAEYAAADEQAVLDPGDSVTAGDGGANGEAGDEAEGGGDAADDDLDKLMSMDIDQLVNVPVASAAVGEIPSSITIPTGTLTATAAAPAAPSTHTHITREMIEKSGARNLNELLDIFVPNLQVIRHHAHYTHVGIRGTISDREDKYLLRVNGRTMNQRMLVGADNERDLPLLRDIYSIDVIRGSGSPTYGAGALAGVVSITTLNGLTFEGLDSTARQGFEQEMSTAELRWGKRLGEDVGVFMYYGYADQNGANANPSPVIYGRSGALPNAYPPNVAGEPAPFGYPNDEESLFNGPKHKVHFQFTHRGFDFWTRYTRGSYINANQVRNMFRPPYGVATANAILEDRPGSGGDYQQLTYFASQVLELSDTLQLSAIASYDFYDYVETRINAVTSFFPSREEEAYFRVMGQYAPNEVHTFAAGYEHSREMFGLDTPLSDFPTRGQRLGIINDPWVTHTGSIFGEYRLKLLDPLTVILAGRMDEHTYSNRLFSPRVSTMYDLTDIDLLKFNIGQSVRKPGDEELRAQFLANGTIAEEEELGSTELRWERRPDANLYYGASVFHQNHDVVGFSGSISRSTLLGTFESWGWEVEGVYDLGNTYLAASHGYVKLLNSSLVDPNLIQGISAAPYGFGNDFANWSNHVSKFAVARDLTESANLSGSLRVYWAFPGARDLAQYNETLAPSFSGSIAQADPGYDKAFEANVYLDAGYQYHWTQHIAWRLDLYNILGWFDVDLNKRNYINRVADYRPEAAAVGVSVTATY